MSRARRAAAAAPPPPVLYLLHGRGDDDTAWTRYTALERHLLGRQLAVVMPDVRASFYCDETYGGKYWTYLTEELPHRVSDLFRVDHQPAATFVAGLSMGGYGALKWALRHPDRIAAAASMSGALDLVRLYDASSTGEEAPDWRRIFGANGPAETDDLLALIARADADQLPPLRVSCGTADSLYTDNVTFERAAGAAGVALSTQYIAGADHEWGLWDEQIRQVLDWLPLPG